MFYVLFIFSVLRRIPKICKRRDISELMRNSVHEKHLSVKEDAIAALSLENTYVYVFFFFPPFLNEI